MIAQTCRNHPHLKRLRRRLLQRAIRRHGRVEPCGRHSGWDACFTVEEGRLILWYNTPHDQSTHIVTALVVEPDL